MRVLRPAAFVLASLLGLAEPLPAQAQTALTNAATGQVSVPPDEASATLTVQAQDVSAARAQNMVNTGMARALALARKLPGLKAVTGQYSTYSVAPDNGVAAQFSAQQTLQLTLSAPDGVPPEAFSNLLGSLQQEGLLLNSLDGDLSDAGQRQAEQAAINDALGQIKAQAAAVAANLQEAVGGIKSLDVNAASAPGPQPRMMAMAMPAAAPPQSAPENLQVTASLTAVIDLSTPH